MSLVNQIAATSTEFLATALTKWQSTASTYGMTREEINQQNRVITQHVKARLEERSDTNQTFYLKRNPKDRDGPSRAVEFFFKNKTITVITHLKQKGDQQPLGIGFHAVVKRSIVSLQLDMSDAALREKTLLPGALIADKVPKKKAPTEKNIDAFVHESTFTALFDNATNIRQLVAGINDRDSKLGILLVGTKTTLKECFSTSGSFTRNQKIKVAKDLVNGLLEMQAKNVVHRDLHMKNCGLSYDNVWMIQDFGLARYEGDAIDLDASLNFNVASPHLIINKLNGIQSIARICDDGWALGLILYEIEFERPPQFIENLRIVNLLQALKLRHKLLVKIDQLNAKTQETILNWDGKASLLLDSKEKTLAEEYYAKNKNLFEQYKLYKSDVGAFMTSLEKADEDILLKELILDLLKGNTPHYSCSKLEVDSSYEENFYCNLLPTEAIKEPLYPYGYVTAEELQTPLYKYLSI